MKTKILSALLALCLLASLLSPTVLAEDPSVTVTFINKDESTITATVAPGAIKYVTTNADGLMSEWTDTAAAPADNFIKLEYPADGAATLKVTLNNINANSESEEWHNPAIEFGEGNYAVVLELVGTNKIFDCNSAGIKYSAANGMTITGAGTLSLSLSGSVAGAIWANGGDLLIKDTTVDLTVAQGNHSLHHAIFASKGSVTIEGSKLTSTTDGGSCVYLGTTDEKAGGAKGSGRYTLDDATDRFIKIKDSTVTVTVKQNRNAFQSANPCTITNSTVKITLPGISSGPCFNPAPTIEGEYTAIAGLAKNAEKLDKLKEYNPKKQSSYTYFYMEPGIKDLLPKEEPTTEATKPAETKPVETKPVETKPVETKPVETKPVETKPVETKPVETKPVETKPVETKPVETNPVDTDKDTEEKSGSPLKVVLIILIVLIVAGGAAVGVIFYLRSKNTAEAEGEETEEAEAEAEEE